MLRDGYGVSLTKNDAIETPAGVVLTREQGTAGGEAISWTGVHVWSFRHGRAKSFVAYMDADYQQFWSQRT